MNKLDTTHHGIKRLGSLGLGFEYWPIVLYSQKGTRASTGKLLACKHHLTTGERRTSTTEKSGDSDLSRRAQLLMSHLVFSQRSANISSSMEPSNFLSNLSLNTLGNIATGQTYSDFLHFMKHLKHAINKKLL